MSVTTWRRLLETLCERVHCEMFPVSKSPFHTTYAEASEGTTNIRAARRRNAVKRGPFIPGWRMGTPGRACYFPLVTGCHPPGGRALVHLLGVARSDTTPSSSLAACLMRQ